MPTMLDLLGVPLPPGLQGVSHAQALRERGAVEDRPLFFVSADTGRFAVRDSGWKLIHDPREGTSELYSLERDPYERRNVAAERPGRAEEILRKLEAWLDALPRPYTATTASAVTLDDETIRELKALGYVR